MIDAVSKFSVIFSSILLEALPFILIGAILSAVMQIFVTEEMIRKFIPRNTFLGSVVASVLGVILPVCECVTVPITKSLIQKKVPINVAITYMLAAPIVSPIVIASTYIAFDGDIKFVVLRVGLGILIAILTGLIMLPLTNKKEVLKTNFESSDYKCDCGCEEILASNDNIILKLLKSSSIEFYSIGKYFVVASMLAAVFQLNVTEGLINSLGINHVIGILIMMFISFALSLCSEADAFFAHSFVSGFSTGGIVSFLIIGPMVDLKNVSMMFSYFKKDFIVKLVFVVFSLTFIVTAFMF
ncbi:MAG: permease [Sarcina sp.]